MKKSLVIHPFLFAGFPVLFLFTHNTHLFHVGAIIGSLTITSCLALLVWAVLSLVLKDKRKAGLMVSLFLLLFFSYESSFDGIRDFIAGVGWITEFMVGLGVTPVGIRGSLLLIWIVILSVSAYFVIRTRRPLHDFTNVANAMGSVLVLLSLFDIGTYYIRTRSAWQDIRGTESIEPVPAGLQEPNTLPNIFYIILDGYARADMLQEIYQHDNAEFVDYLTRRGFYVASKSRSNYSQTFLSLASSLNMTYLDNLAAGTGTESRSRRPAVNMIWYNDVFHFLKRYGYVTVAFSSGWWGTEITNADIYMAPRWQPDFFERELIETTPLPFLTRQLGLGVQDQHGSHRERIFYTLDRLVEVSELEDPLFVFAHIVAPHPPFVFGRHGEEIEPESRFTLMDGEQIIGKGTLTQDKYVERYRDQLIFVNGVVKEALDGILSRSTRPPIIILQADHGPGSTLDWDNPDNTSMKERFAILNGYYLPNEGDMHLYDGITPVNTFRVILNRYFGTDYELLDDESYFSTYDRPYAFVNVTDEVNDSIGTGHLE